MQRSKPLQMQVRRQSYLRVMWRPQQHAHQQILWLFALWSKVSSLTTTHSGIVFSPPAVTSKIEVVGSLVNLAFSGPDSSATVTNAIDLVRLSIDVVSSSFVSRSAAATHRFSSVTALRDEGSTDALAKPLSPASQLSECFDGRNIALLQSLQF